MTEHKPVYRYSLKEAINLGEKDLWKESHEENCRCAEEIKAIIWQNFDGLHMKDGCAETVISEFGYDRVQYVLANTIELAGGDGRYSEKNKQWARSFQIPRDDHRYEFALNSHPVLVNGLTDQVRKAYQKLGLFDASHCENGDQDYTGKVVVIQPDTLKDEFKTPDDQLFLVKGGNGARPNGIGRKVFGEFLKDGESTHFFRDEIVGVLKYEHLPAWAEEKLHGVSEDTPTMTMQ